VWRRRWAPAASAVPASAQLLSAWISMEKKNNRNQTQGVAGSDARLGYRYPDPGAKRCAPISWLIDSPGGLNNICSPGICLILNFFGKIFNAFSISYSRKLKSLFADRY